MLLPILFTLAFIAVSVPLVAAPLRRKVARVMISEPVSDRASGATASYEATLLALRDLAFDHQLGVINDDDYAQLHEHLVSQAATALDSPSRADQPAAAAAAIEAAIRRRREQRPGPATRFCPQCGNPVDAGDHYCTDCGHPLTESEKEQI